jgi:tetratricopeptide (TPR) repeat protein
LTPETWRRLKQIVSDARERPPPACAAFLDAQCAGDAWLRREVDDLLRAADDAASLYEPPIVGATRSSAAVLDAGRPVAAGDRIGAYRVVRELGHGGMGRVYLADRADGEFEQQVAIKFVGGIGSPDLVRRFREERRILAALAHPNIARLLDAGTTADGHPHVIMEYVAGLPIDGFCEREQLSTRRRIALFHQVCAAVHYAHQRLVIHRDIKASNILVTPDGTPKLLDFGIATFVQQDAASRTATIWRALTLESASPEQVRGELITVASDVYALAVLFYRLLAGRSPYGDATNNAALLRAICEDEPAPPGIDRDLDLIVLKALRKEPDRRYSSVEQFSGDLTRYLSGRPVLAAPDSRRYRAIKFVRRHRVAVATGAAALLAIVIGSGAALYQAQVAERERARAEQRLADVRRLANSFVFEFHDAIADLPGSLKARQLVVKRAAEYLDNLAREGADDVDLQRELASAYQRLGDIVGGPGVSNLGDVKGALHHFQTALDVRERLAERGVSERPDLEGLADIRVRLSRVYVVIGDFGRSEANAREAVITLQSIQVGPSNDDHAGPLASAHHQLGYIQTRRANYAGALASFEQAMILGQRSVGARPDDARELSRLARIQADYAEQLSVANRPEDALPVVDDAQRRLEALIARDPTNQRYSQTLVVVHGVRGRALWMLKEVERALEAFAAAVATADAVSAASPDDQGMRFGAAQAHQTLGDALAESNRAAGLAHLRRAKGTFAAMAKAMPGNDYFAYQLATAALDLGDALHQLNRIDGAGCAEIAGGLSAWENLVARQRLPGEASPYSEPYKFLRAMCP